MAKRFFESETHTFLYSKFRRPITETIINPAVEYLSELSKPPCDLVVDVGCGTGQSTNLLSKYAKRVFGVDISEGQIKYANENPDKPENVDYFVGPSEDMAFVKNCSVDMVSASACFHWFDHPKFYKECQRILKPNGVLAIYGYYHINVTSEKLNSEQNRKIQEIINHFYSILDQIEDPAVKMLKSKYNGITLPFDDVKKLEINEKYEETVELLLGFFKSMSAIQALFKKSPQKAEELFEITREGLEKAFANKWNGDESPLTITCNYEMMLGRRPK